MRRGLGFHARRSPGGFNPLSLFAGGVNGTWYDPSDSTTLFSDRAGTTPCAAPGAGAVVPVGAMLDERATAYSVFFDGTGDYLSVPDSAAFDFGAGEWTVEAWFYRTNSVGATSAPILAQSVSGAASNSATYFGAGNDGIAIYLSTSGTSWTNFMTSSTAPTQNTWAHIVWQRRGNTLEIYLNGVSQAASGGSSSFSGTVFNSSRAVEVGAQGGSGSTAGYISNLRVVKGTAVYTGAFTPPTSPLSPISGTSLLTCGTSWTGNPAITKNGDARVDGLNPFQTSPVGNHAIAANDTTARPELSARVNLLTATEDQSNGVWAGYLATQQSNVGIAPDGTNTADRIVEASGSSLQARYQAIASGLSIQYTVRAYAKADQRNVFNLSYSGTGGTNWFAATFELTGNGSVTKTGAGAAGTYTSSSITPVGNGWYLCAVTGSPGQASTHYVYGGPSDTTNPTYGNFGVLTYTGNTANGVLVWGFDVRPTNIGSQIPAYQRVVDANTYDSAGFPRRLVFNGTSSAMSTPANVNLSGTDKATVFAGVRKNSDAAIQAIAETSAVVDANNGAMAVGASIGAAQRWFSALRGTSLAYYEPATYAAPITSVLATSFDIAGAAIANEIVPRVNGVVEQDNPTGANAGTGNFGSYPLFIGSRNNASLFLNGDIYSLIVVGSAVSAGNITATETWVNGKTGGVY